MMAENPKFSTGKGRYSLLAIDSEAKQSGGQASLISWDFFFDRRFKKNNDDRIACRQILLTQALYDSKLFKLRDPGTGKHPVN